MALLTDWKHLQEYLQGVETSMMASSKEHLYRVMEGTKCVSLRWEGNIQKWTSDYFIKEVSYTPSELMGVEDNFYKFKRVGPFSPTYFIKAEDVHII
jgi:hypothetical protein